MHFIYIKPSETCKVLDMYIYTFIYTIFSHFHVAKILTWTSGLVDSELHPCLHHIACMDASDTLGFVLDFGTVVKKWTSISTNMNANRVFY